MSYMWLILFIVLLLIEICTINLVSIWFAIGALVSFFVSIFTDNIVIQLAVFIIVSVISFLITKPLMKKIKNSPNKTKLNLDRIVGMEGIVTEDISKFKIGEVKVDGKRWSAKAESDINTGSIIIVEKIDGVKLIVRKKEDE